MIVILLKDLKGTGKAGEVVKVSDGYARNVLIPKGVAREATEGNVRSLEKQKALAIQKEEENKAKAIELAKLYGSEESGAVLRKLGVNNRRAAVRRAGELSLL